MSYMTKCIILDIDGVIVYSKKAMKKIYSEAMLGWDYKVTDRDIDTIIGMHGKDICGHFLKQCKELKTREEFRNAVKKAAPKYVDYYELTPLGNTLNFLAQKHTLCVATNRNRESAGRILEHFKIAKLFSHVASVSDHEPKPSPDMLLACVEKAGVKKEEALFMGDTEVDKLAGEKAGINTVIVMFE